MRGAANLPFLGYLLKLTRFWNLFIIALAQACAAIFLINRFHLEDVRLYVLILSTVLIAAGGYIINDYYDVKIDYINKPGRVVVGRNITRRLAIIFHIFFSVAGIALGTLLSFWIGLINFLCALLLWWYSNYLKRLAFVGNFAVAFLTGAAIIVIDVLYRTPNTTVFAYAVFAFFMTLIREVIKDMEDVEGDQMFGSTTLPIVLGIRRSKAVVYVVTLLFMVSAILMNVFWRGLLSRVLIYALPIPLACLSYFLYGADTVRAFHRLSQWCKVIMLLGIGSMILA